MHKKCRNLHFWVDIFRYFFRLEVSFGNCFQEGAQKFEAGKTYFRSILYPYLREGYRKGENQIYRVLVLVERCMTPQKKRNNQNLGCLSIYVPLKPTEAPKLWVFKF